MHYMKSKMFWKGFEVLNRNIVLRTFHQMEEAWKLDKLWMCRWLLPTISQVENTAYAYGSICNVSLYIGMYQEFVSSF